jgi:hypothetical protein
MEDGQGEKNQDGVGEPGIQSDKVKTLGHMIGVEKLEDVEVEEIEAVAAFADQEKRAPGEEGGDGVGAAQAENQGCEDGSHETAVHEEVRSLADQVVEEDPQSGEADSGEDEALTRSEDEGMLQLAESDAGEEGADVGERGVLEEADELGGAVAVDRTYEVVGVEVEVEGVGDEADDPEANQESDQLQRAFGPG